MSGQRRHGLRTVVVGGRGAGRAEDTALVLAGRTTRWVRRLDGAAEGGPERLEVVGERQLLLDDGGRAVAVLHVDAVEVTTLGRLVAPTSDPLTSGPFTSDGITWCGDAPPDGTSADAAVAVISFHVVGLAGG